MNYYPTLALLLLAYMSLWFLITKKRNDVADGFICAPTFKSIFCKARYFSS